LAQIANKKSLIWRLCVLKSTLSFIMWLLMLSKQIG